MGASVKIMKMENQFWVLEHDYYDKEDELYYCHKTKKWVTKEKYIFNGGKWLPSGFPCKSYRAARRHLRKHHEIPVGTKFRLVSKFIGFDRYLVKK